MSRTKYPQVILDAAAVRSLESAHAQAQPPLMERAGRAAADWALELLHDRPGQVLVLCGPGNNGGDGFVLARVLREAGCALHLVCVTPPQRLPADARAACGAWLDAGGRIETGFAGQGWALVVDAMFGIGLRRPLAAPYADWIARVAECSAPVLALDVPSGLDAWTGRVPGVCVRATHTAVFIAHKAGLLTLDGPDYAGQLRLFDLDLKPDPAPASTLAPEMFRPWLRARPHNVHKGLYGAAGVIGGAPGMQGAALLAARAALHMGAGKVFGGILDPACAGVDAAFPELMLRPPEDIAGLASALAIGPGLGQGERARALLEAQLAFAGPLLLDADALNLVAQQPAWRVRLAARAVPAVLTPHPAEAARLLQTTTAAIQADRVASARALAQRHGAVVVLKGCGSVVAAPDGRWFINTSGHGGMAVAGMGDVLSGLTLALLAQHWPPLEAAAAACHLHGCAAERLAQEACGPVGLLASETIVAARRVFNGWLQS